MERAFVLREKGHRDMIADAHEASVATLPTYTLYGDRV